MAGSEAEERIRAKVEARLRDASGRGARIVHELVLDQGGIRIDLAAVEESRLIVAEIKSERDTLKRLKDQVRRAREVAQGVWVVVAAKHEAEIRRRTEHYVYREVYGPARPSQWRAWHRNGEAGVPPAGRISERNPDYDGELAKCLILVEPSPDEPLRPMAGANVWRQDAPWPRPGEMLEMLWADELRRVLGRHRLAVDSRTTRTVAMLRAIESMTGAEIRRAVCACIRARPFPRADDPIPWAEPAGVTVA